MTRGAAIPRRKSLRRKGLDRVLTFDVHSRADDDCNRNLSSDFFVGHLSTFGCVVVCHESIIH